MTPEYRVGRPEGNMTKFIGEWTDLEAATAEALSLLSIGENNKGICVYRRTENGHCPYFSPIVLPKERASGRVFAVDMNRFADEYRGSKLVKRGDQKDAVRTFMTLHDALVLQNTDNSNGNLRAYYLLEAIQDMETLYKELNLLAAHFHQ